MMLKKNNNSKKVTFGKLENQFTIAKIGKYKENIKKFSFFPYKKMYLRVNKLMLEGRFFFIEVF